MKVGDLVKHKKFDWMGHIVALQPVRGSIWYAGDNEECLIVDVIKANGSLNRFPSIDLEVLDGT